MNLAGRPFVLAHLEQWQPTAGETAAIRAQLRGLGARLLVTFADGAILLGPDDAPRAVQLDAPSDHGPGVHIIDAQLRTRARHDAPANAAPQLLAALREAVHRRRHDFSRRELLVTTLVGAFALTWLAGCAEAPITAQRAETPAPVHAPGEVKVTLHLNGQVHELWLEPRVTLLDALRERLGLTGAKKGCDAGQCGACTVLAGTKRINACLALAIQYDGRPITSIEGLAQADSLHPMQAAFIEHDALQCGYCTPGQILSAIGLLHEEHVQSDHDVRAGMTGNLCRCGAYPNIVAAIRAAKAQVAGR